MKKVILLLLFHAVSTMLFSQNFKQDLEKMYQQYNTLENYRTDVVMKAFESKDKNSLIFSRRGAINKKGNQFYYDFGFMEIMVNQRYSIVLQKEEQLIIYKPLKQEEKLEMEDITGMQDFNKLIDNYESVKYLGQHQGIKHYKIIPKHTFVQVDLYLYQSGLIQKLIYEYESDNIGTKVVHTEFINSTTSPRFKEDLFSESKYFVKKGKNVIPTTAYQSYNLINISENEF